MNITNIDKSERTGQCCTICHSGINPGEEYEYNSKLLCEDCCITLRTPLARKTHWRYLKSIKTEYLIPGSGS